MSDSISFIVAESIEVSGRVRHLCDLALVVESDDTQRIQETHNLFGHVLCDLVERFFLVMRSCEL
jgi:predicted MarR family transcription regulator